jgi:hypothetical protein
MIGDLPAGDTERALAGPPLETLRRVKVPTRYWRVPDLPMDAAGCPNRISVRTQGLWPSVARPKTSQDLNGKEGVAGSSPAEL